jgi:hypothetical protein
MTRSRLAGPRRAVLGMLVASLGVLAFASSANAETHHPTGEYKQFADCPLSNPLATDCLYATTTGGEFVIGKEKVPIVNTITLQAGISKFFSGEETIIAAEDGNTLSKTPQKVPGGLAGLVKCNEIENFFLRLGCELVFENGVTGVNAITELAGPASSIGLHSGNLLGGTGTALSLPVKVRLENPFLGSSCYIGSNAKPIVIEFTTAAPGSPGEVTTNKAETIITISKNILVNKTFAAPKVEGCAGGLLDGLVDSKLGLPSASGKNSATLKGTLQVAEAAAVKASE